MLFKPSVQELGNSEFTCSLKATSQVPQIPLSMTFCLGEAASLLYNLIKKDICLLARLPAHHLQTFMESEEHPSSVQQLGTTVIH